jgi:hypothetical protein
MLNADKDANIAAVEAKLEQSQRKNYSPFQTNKAPKIHSYINNPADAYMHAALSGDKRALEVQHEATDTANRLNRDNLKRRAKGEGLLDFNDGAFREGNSRDAIGGLPVGGTYSEDETYRQYLHTRKKDGTIVTSGYTRGGIDRDTFKKNMETAAKINPKALVKRPEA